VFDPNFHLPLIPENRPFIGLPVIALSGR